MSDIKMSEVFDLPISGVSEWSDYHAATFCYFNDGQRDLQGSNHMEAAAHAINNHDKLTSRVAELEAALLAIKSHQQALTPSGFEFSGAWQIADKALKESE